MFVALNGFLAVQNVAVLLKPCGHKRPVTTIVTSLYSLQNITTITLKDTVHQTATSVWCSDV